MSGPSRARARGARLGGSRLVKGAAGAAVSLQKSRLDVPPVGHRPCRTRPGTGRTVRGVALLSCAVSVRSHWSGVTRLAWCSRGSPVRSRPWPGRARRVGPWALGSARGRRSAPSPAARPRCERAIWHMGENGIPVFVLTVVTNTVNSAIRSRSSRIPCTCGVGGTKKRNRPVRPKQLSSI